MRTTLVVTLVAGALLSGSGAVSDENLRRLAQSYFDFYREEPDYLWLLYFGGTHDTLGNAPTNSCVRPLPVPPRAPSLSVAGPRVPTALRQPYCTPVSVRAGHVEGASVVVDRVGPGIGAGQVCDPRRRGLRGNHLLAQLVRAPASGALLALAREARGAADDQRRQDGDRRVSLVTRAR
jgi:hypothetical protein